MFQTHYSPTQTQSPKVQQRYVFVLELLNGHIVVGSATNPCKRIAAINSGLCKAVPKSLQVHRVVGIKEQTQERNLVSVFKTFEERRGVGKVIAV
jgi:hypothetical protein